MCGIAGGINCSFVDFEKIKNSLLHRGPDEQNILQKDRVSLLQTRLAIIDAKCGSQPMRRGDFIIAFNGEIYNYKELKEELGEFEFESSSDTEVLLNLYIKYKERALEKIDGMFAFCIYDIKKGELFLARDRAGKKPLYFLKRGDLFFFASELNSFKSFDLRIDFKSIEAFLRCGFFYRKYTPYLEVEELESGSFMRVDVESLSVEKRRWFDMLELYTQDKIASYEESKNSVESSLKRSIQDRLLSSDLEVGAFLSGGIDSSLIVAMASSFREKLKTFTVKFDGGYDESSLAKLVAQKYKTDHVELEISLNLKDDIEKILQNYGEPFFDSSAIPSYYVSLEAKKHLTVILNGDGADELFGGYRRYVVAANNLLKYAGVFSPLLGFLPKPKDKKSLYNYAYRLLSMGSKSGIDLYLSSTTDIFEDEYKFLQNSVIKEMEEKISIASSRLSDGLDRALYLDFEMLLFGDLLVKMDIATMSNSLEGRSPFLSKYLLELAPKIDSRYKISGKTTKYILRDLAKEYLPSELLNQPKRGFEVPLKRWVERDLRENIYDALDSNCFCLDFIDRAFLDDLLKKPKKFSPEKRAKMLWNLYSLEVWKKYA